MPLHHRNFGQVTHLLEPQALVDPPGGLVVVEVHAQQRRHPQPRALLDHPLLEPPTDPSALQIGAISQPRVIPRIRLTSRGAQSVPSIGRLSDAGSESSMGGLLERLMRHG